MNRHLALLMSATVLSTFGLTACDSATATNEKKTAEVAKPEAVVEQVVEKAVEAPKAVIQAAVATAPKIETAVASATSEVTTAVESVEKKVEVAASEAAKAPKLEPVAAAAVEKAVPKKPKYKEGQHYFEIFPAMQTDAVGGKVEVVELMWLGCPHCFHLEPTIKAYKKTLPDYIDFKQIPAMLNPRWVADAKTFYVAEILDPKGTKKLIDKVFHAIHVQKRARMASPDVVKRFMLQQGITEAEFDNAANSMVLQAKLNRGRQVSADSQAQSVPTLIINGRYRTSPYAAGGEKQLIEIVNMLTKREFEK
ncbi:MAG: thioredoxin domain-containing protein [Leucothrix sp.]